MPRYCFELQVRRDRREEYKARHRERMELRAKERGIDPQVTND